MYMYRCDLLDPNRQFKCKTKLFDDESTIDPFAVYSPSESPNRMLVRDLKSELGSEDKASKFCLDESQREAIECALSQPLTLIQVSNDQHD